MDMVIGQTTLGELLPLLILLLISVSIEIILIVLIICSLKRKKYKEKSKKKDTNLLQGKFKHICGLNIPIGMECEVFSYPDKYEIKSGAMIFTLDKSKVTDVKIDTRKFVNTQYVSSIGDAIGGAHLFGIWGAIFGGRIRSMNKKIVTSYLIITYKKGNNLTYVNFDASKSKFIAETFEKEFKDRKSITSINL